MEIKQSDGSRLHVFKSILGMVAIQKLDDSSGENIFLPIEKQSIPAMIEALKKYVE